MTGNSRWWVFTGQDYVPRDYSDVISEIPPHRALSNTRGKNFVLDAEKYKDDETTVDLINAALYLKRPLLVKGMTGVGKSALADAIAYRLRLPLLSWPITSHSNLKEGLYDYDIVGHVADQTTNPVKKGAKSTADSQLHRSKPIDAFLSLKALGTAFANQGNSPVVLLVDELDKGDMDFPNGLLHVLESGSFEIPELIREGDTDFSIRTSFDGISENDPNSQFVEVTNQIKKNRLVKIKGGKVVCRPELLPIVVMTSNGEREFPAPFLRRCIQLDLQPPDGTKLYDIIKKHFEGLANQKGKSLESKRIDELIRLFLENRVGKELSTDTLLNAVYMHLFAPGVKDGTLENMVSASHETKRI